MSAEVLEIATLFALRNASSDTRERELCNTLSMMHMLNVFFLDVVDVLPNLTF